MPSNMIEEKNRCLSTFDNVLCNQSLIIIIIIKAQNKLMKN